MGILAEYRGGIDGLDQEIIDAAGLGPRVSLTETTLALVDVRRNVQQTIQKFGIAGFSGYLTIKGLMVTATAYEVGPRALEIISLGSVSIEDQNRVVCAMAAGGIAVVSSWTFYLLLAAIGSKIIGDRVSNNDL